MSRRTSNRERKVVALPIDGRPVDAIGVLSAACANSAIKGLVMIMIDECGVVDTRVFGNVSNGQICWAGAVLQSHAMKDELE